MSYHIRRLIVSKADNLFQDVIRDIMENGTMSGQARPKYKDGRTAHSKYRTMVYHEYDLSKGEFPITTLRPIAWKTAIREMYTFYVTQSNKLSDFEKNGVGYWKDWVINPNDPYDDQNIGNTYGAIVGRHGITDRILKQLAENPFNRRNVLSLWDYEAFDETPDALKPCAWNFMMDVRQVGDDMYLDGLLTMRSNDMLVAHHMDTIQYTAFMMMIAKHFGWKLGKFAYIGMNCHIYDNQFEQAEEILNRKPSDNEPYLKLNVPDGTNFYDITPDDFEMVNYEPTKPQLKFDLAI